MVTAKEIVAVLINYRDAKRSLLCIESLQNNQVDKIIVWDNSDDGGNSLSELQLYIAGFQNVETIYSEKNIGFAAAMNR